MLKEFFRVKENDTRYKLDPQKQIKNKEDEGRVPEMINIQVNIKGYFLSFHNFVKRQLTKK